MAVLTLPKTLSRPLAAVYKDLYGDARRDDQGYRKQACSQLVPSFAFLRKRQQAVGDGTFLKDKDINYHSLQKPVKYRESETCQYHFLTS